MSTARLADLGNAANAFNAGIRGRHRKSKLGDDHRLLGATCRVMRFSDGDNRRVEDPALIAYAPANIRECCE